MPTTDEHPHLRPRPRPRRRPNLTPEQREAQRVIVSLSQPRSGRLFIDPDTMDLRYSERRTADGPSLREVSRLLVVLDVGHRMVVAAPPTGATRVDAWVELAVSFEDRPALFRWVPSLAAKVAQAEGVSPPG